MIFRSWMMFLALLALLWHSSARADELADVVARLKDDDPKTRSQAVTDLGGSGPQADATIPELIRLLAETSSIEAVPGLYYPEVRRDVVNALVRIGPAAVPAVIDALQDSTIRELRIGAAMTLVAFGPNAKGTLPAFTKGLKDRDDRIRELSAQGLAALGIQAAGQMDPLSKLLREDPSESVRFQVAFTLRSIDPEGTRSVPQLGHALGDKSPEVRSAAARALGELGPKAMAAVPALVARLDDQGVRYEMMTLCIYEPREVRVDVAEALDLICGSKGFGAATQAQGAAEHRVPLGMTSQCRPQQCCSRQKRQMARACRRGR
jgi:HEAT repeat protein